MKIMNDVGCTDEEWERWTETAKKAKADMSSYLPTDYISKERIHPSSSEIEMLNKAREEARRLELEKFYEMIMKKRGHEHELLERYRAEEAICNNITNMLGDENDDPAQVRRRDKNRPCDIYGKGLDYE